MVEAKISSRRWLGIAVGLFVVLVTTGTVGYRLLEGWPWFDCLYHTVITLSTIGYQELHPLSQAGRAFTIFLVVFSVIGTALALQAVTSIVIEGRLGEVFWRRRMERDIAALEDHVLVCGYGRMGSYVADSLERAGRTVVVIERAAERIQDAVDAGLAVLEGDATSDATLRQAGAERASQAVCCLPSDADNVFATLSLRVLNPDMRVIARHDSPATREKLLRAGADIAVSPVLMGGRRVVNVILRPAATELLDLAVAAGGPDLRLEELVIGDGSSLVGRTLRDSELRDVFDVMVVAVRHQDGRWIHCPSPQMTLEPGTTVVVIGRADGVTRLIEREGSA